MQAEISIVKVGFKISLRIPERWIRKLRDDGKIKFKGSKKAGGYYSA
jgi:hypothetical protein